MSSFFKCIAYAKASHIFSAKNISMRAIFNDQSFNNTLTNDIISFEQLGPVKVLFFSRKVLGPVVQSIVSLMNLLRVISLTVLADSIYSFLIFFAEKIAFASYSHFFSAKNFSIFAYHSM